MPASSTLTAATTAYRRRIRAWEDEEELVGTVRFGTRQTREIDGKTIGNRFRMPIDLRYPAPWEGEGRPVSRLGRSSFHFGSSVVCKGDAGGRAGGKAGSSSERAAPANPAAEHERYLADAIDAKKAVALRFEGYLADSDELQPEASRAVYICSTIGDTLAERTTFWDDVWARERTASPNVLEFDLDRCGENHWRWFAQDPHAPTAVRKLAEKALAGELALPSRPGRKPRRRLVEVEVGSEAEPGWAAQINPMFGSSKKERAVHYREGRAGQVQMRIEAELPNELGADAWSWVADQFSSDLRKLGVPHTAVVHRPSGHNDPRNPHLHAILHPRCCPTGSDGKHDLGAGRKLRPGDIAAAFPFESNEAPNRGDTGSGHLTLARRDMKALRHRMAEHLNAALERQGYAPRYDPRTFEEMGIQRTPNRPLRSGAAALMRAGVSVEADRHNSVVSWAARRREEAERARDRRIVHQDALFDLHRRAARGPHDRSTTRRLWLLERLMDAADDGLERLAEHDFARDQAESASLRLIGHTDRLLQEIVGGTASRSDARLEPDINARNILARRHLDEVQVSAAPFEEEVARFRRIVARRERRVDDLIAMLTADLTALAVRRWQAGSVLATYHPEPLSPDRHFDALIQAIHSQERKPLAIEPVHVSLAPDGRHVVAGLGLLDQNLLARDRFAGRREAALAGVLKRQRGEMEKVLAHVRKEGVPLCRIPGRVGDLWMIYRDHPEYRLREAAAQSVYELREFGAGVALGPAPTAVAGHSSVVPATPVVVDTSVPSQDGKDVPDAAHHRSSTNIVQSVIREDTSENARGVEAAGFTPKPTATPASRPVQPVPYPSRTVGNNRADQEIATSKVSKGPLREESHPSHAEEKEQRKQKNNRDTGSVDSKDETARLAPKVQPVQPLSIAVYTAPPEVSQSAAKSPEATDSVGELRQRPVDNVSDENRSTHIASVAQVADPAPVARSDATARDNRSANVIPAPTKSAKPTGDKPVDAPVTTASEAEAKKSSKSQVRAAPDYAAMSASLDRKKKRRDTHQERGRGFLEARSTSPEQVGAGTTNEVADRNPAGLSPRPVRPSSAATAKKAPSSKEQSPKHKPAAPRGAQDLLRDRWTAANGPELFINTLEPYLLVAQDIDRGNSLAFWKGGQLHLAFNREDPRQRIEELATQPPGLDFLKLIADNLKATVLPEGGMVRLVTDIVPDQDVFARLRQRGRSNER